MDLPAALQCQNITVLEPLSSRRSAKRLIGLGQHDFAKQHLCVCGDGFDLHVLNARTQFWQEEHKFRGLELDIEDMQAGWAKWKMIIKRHQTICTK